MPENMGFLAPKTKPKSDHSRHHSCPFFWLPASVRARQLFAVWLLGLRGLPLYSNSPLKSEVYRLALEAPRQGNAEEAQAIFWKYHPRLDYGSAPWLTLKRLVGRTTNRDFSPGGRLFYWIHEIVVNLGIKVKFECISVSFPLFIPFQPEQPTKRR